MLGVEPDQLHELLDPALALGAAGRLVDGERVTDDRPDPAPRVQRPVRILEDHLHLAPERAHLPGLELADVLAVEDDLAGGQVEQPGDAAGQGRLAAAGLADQAERLAPADLEADPVDRVHELPAAPEERPDWTGKCLTRFSTRSRAHRPPRAPAPWPWYPRSSHRPLTLLPVPGAARPRLAPQLGPRRHVVRQPARRQVGRVVRRPAASGGVSVRHRSITYGQRGLERAAGREADQARRLAGDRQQPAPARRRRPAATAAGPRCRGGGWRRRVVARSAFSMTRPAYMTMHVVGDLGDRRRGRG